jgi:hypothetical protein
MFERGSGGKIQSLLQLLHERPRVEGVKQVDVTGRASEDLKGELSGLDKSLRRLLVRVGTVTQGELLDTVAGVPFAEELGDGGIIVGSVLKSLQGVEFPCGLRYMILLEFLQKAGVVLGVGEDGNAGVVLRSGAEEGDTTDIDLFDGLGDGNVDLGDGILEGI